MGCGHERGHTSSQTSRETSGHGYCSEHTALPDINRQAFCLRIWWCAQMPCSLNSFGQTWSTRHCCQEAWLNVNLGADSAFRDPLAGIRAAVRNLQTFRMMLLCSHCPHICREHAAVGSRHGFSAGHLPVPRSSLGTSAALEGWPHSGHALLIALWEDDGVWAWPQLQLSSSRTNWT